MVNYRDSRGVARVADDRVMPIEGKWEFTDDIFLLFGDEWLAANFAECHAWQVLLSLVEYTARSRFQIRLAINLEQLRTRKEGFFHDFFAPHPPPSPVGERTY